MRIDRLFVYRTLKPGQSRWPALAPYVEPSEPVVDAEIDGQVWATPWGWPALTPGTSRVPGVLLVLQPDRVTEALGFLDDIEGVGSGLFERVGTTTRCGASCWVYLWPGDTAGFTPLGFSSLQSDGAVSNEVSGSPALLHHVRH